MKLFLELINCLYSHKSRTALFLTHYLYRNPQLKKVLKNLMTDLNTGQDENKAFVIRYPGLVLAMHALHFALIYLS